MYFVDKETVMPPSWCFTTSSQFRDTISRAIIGPRSHRLIIFRVLSPRFYFDDGSLIKNKLIRNAIEGKISKKDKNYRSFALNLEIKSTTIIEL